MDRAATIAEIRQRLDSIGDPCSVAHGTPMGLSEMGLVRNVEVDGEGHVLIELRLTSPTCMMIGYFDVEASRRVSEIPGVTTVEVRADHGLDWLPSMMSESAQRRRRASLQARGMSVPPRRPT
jgi:metal-sulfur cluster biosynthetic enzyme